MKPSNETTFHYLLVNIAIGIIAAILLVPRSGPMPLQYLRKEVRDKLRSFMGQAIKLRDRVYRVREKRQFISPNLETAGKAEKQAYEEEKLNYSGG